jgi:RecA-family ATPase
MKKTCTNSWPRRRRFSGPRRLRLFAGAVLAGSLLVACAFTEYGNRINQEQLEIARLEDKRHTLETEYIIVLNNLELHPAEERLIKERDGVRGKLIDVSSLIQEKRKLLDQSYREWEQKIVEEKIEKQMIDSEVKENEGKNEDVEFENK